MSFVLEAVLDKPNQFQIALLQDIKERCSKEAPEYGITDEKILKLLKSKKLLLQEDRLLFFWRVQQLCSLGALAFTDMNTEDFARTLRVHWSKLDFCPTLSKKDFLEILEWVGFLDVHHRMAYVYVYQSHRLDAQGVDAARSLQWLVRKAIDETVRDQAAAAGTIVLMARQFAAMNYFELSPEELQKVGSEIPLQVERYGLTRGQNLETYREISRMRIEFELWYQVVPDILKRKRYRSQAKEEILQLLGEKSVAAEIGHEAKNESSTNCGLANFCLALLDSDRKKYAAALDKFAVAVKLGLTNPALLIEKAYCHFRIGEYMAAAKILDSFEKRNVEESDREFLLDVIENLPADSYFLAWNLVRKYRLIEQLKSEHLREFGEAFLAGGDYETAQTIFEQILKLDPKDSDSYFFIAKICYTRNDVQGAKAWIDKLIELEHRNYYSYYRAALLYLDFGDRGAAIQFLAHALEINPGFEDGQQLLLRLVRENRDSLVELLRVEQYINDSGTLSAAIFDRILEFLDDSGVVIPEFMGKVDVRISEQGVLPTIMKASAAFLATIRKLEVEAGKIETFSLLLDHLTAYSQTFALLESSHSHDKTGNLTVTTAEELFGQRNFKAALELLKLTRDSARDGRWWYLRGACELEINHTSDAESSMREGVARGEPRCMLYLGKIYAGQKRVGEAAEILNTYLSNHAPDAMTCLAIARTFMTFGDLKATQRVLQPFLSSKDELDLVSAMHILYGETLIRMGIKKRSEAEDHFRKALDSLDLANYQGITKRAIEIFNATGRAEFLQNAIKLLTRLTERQESAELLFCLGRIYYESARKKEKKTYVKKGLTYLEDAVAKDQYHYRYRYYCGLMNLLREDETAAAEQFRAALAIFPDHFESLFELGSLDLKKGDEASALALLTRAAEFDKQHSRLQAYLCQLHRKQGAALEAMVHALYALNSTFDDQDLDIRKQMSQQLGEIFYAVSKVEDFATTFLRVLSDPAVAHRREILTVFFREAPGAQMRGETKNLNDLVAPLHGYLEKLKSHASLLNNVPRDLKKATAISEQMMKRCLAGIKEVVEKSNEPLNHIVEIPISHTTRETTESQTAAALKEELEDLLKAITKIEVQKKNRKALEDLEVQNFMATFDYLIEYLKATHWYDRVMDVLLYRVLLSSKPLSIRQQFFTEMLSTLLARKQEGIDQHLHERFMRLQQLLQEVAAGATAIETAWTARADIATPLDAIPQSIDNLLRDFEELDREFKKV